MTTVMTVFSPLGKPLAELDVAVLRSYITNNYQSNVWGTAQFQISRNDAKYSQRFLEFGNLIRCHDEDNQVEDWVGFIDDLKGRQWNDGILTVNAVSAEKILEWRILPYMPIRLEGNAEELLRQALEIVGRMWKLGLELELGSIHPFKAEYALLPSGTLLNFVNSVSKVFGGVGGPACDYEVEGYVDDDDKYLHLRLNMFDGMRGERTGRKLTDANCRMMGEGMRDQGEIWNYVYCYSKEDAPGPMNFQFAWDDKSIARYGLRLKFFEGVGNTPEGLLYQAQVYLNQHRQPERTIPITVMKSAGLHRFVRRGNTFEYTSQAQGFKIVDETIRVTGYEIDDDQNQDARLSSVIIEEE